MATRQSQLTDLTPSTDDHPPIPDGLPYDTWDEIPHIVRNNILNSDGVVRDSFADYAAEQVSQ
jgi:hypothetical protein